MAVIRVLTVFAIAALFPLLSFSQATPPNQFPRADVVLRDAKHKEPKSGVQLSGGQLTIQSGVGTPTTINALSFSLDGELLAAGKDFGRVAVWNAKRREFIRALDTNQGIVSAVALSADGKTLATGGDKDDSSVKLWDVASGKLVQRLQLGGGYVAALIMDRSGRWLIVKHNGGQLIIVETATGKPVLTLQDGLAARFSTDGAALIAQDKQGIGTWETASWSKKATLPQPQESRRLLLAVDTAADRFAVLEKWGIRVLRLSTGEPIAGDVLPKSRTGAPKAVAFSTDGLFVYASIDDRLWVWDTRTNGVCLSPVMYSSGGALSGDGRWFAGSKDDSILSSERTDGVWIWDTAHLMSGCGIASNAKQ